MINTVTQMATMSPYAFGMPARGHVFGATSASTTLRVLGTCVVRDRSATGNAGDLGFAIAALGTTAWSPPTC